MQWLLNLARALGLLVNIPKCDLTPSQVYHFIGILFNLLRGTAQPTPERVDKFLQLAEKFLQQRRLPAVRWQQLLGHMTSLEKLVPRGCLHMRPLQFCLKDQWNSVTQPPGHLVTMTPPATTALQWWTCRPHLTRGVSLQQTTPDVRLFTDASTVGWGAHIDHHQAQGTWSTPLQNWHINCLVLKTVILALQQFRPLVEGHHVIVMSDNTSVVGNIKNQGGDPRPGPSSSDSGTLPVDGQTRRRPVSETHSRSSQRDSRSPLPGSPDHPSGVVAGLTGRRPDLEGVGSSSGGSVRHRRERQAAYVRLSTHRADSLEDRRSLFPVDRPVGLRFSPVSATQPGPREGQQRTL